jgi:hypothetical protein
MLQSGLLRGLIAAVAILLVDRAPDGLAQDAWPPTVPDVFTVRGIAVDATAADAVAARGAALRAGQQEGLNRLLRRLVPAEDHRRLPPASSLPIERYVQNFEIANEELSSTRYLAQLTVAYDPEAVRELARREALPMAELASQPILVLPLYQGPDGARLWADGNPWWQAWAETLEPERLVRLVLPLGDLEDIASLTPEQIQAGDEGAVLALAARYGAQDALVVPASPLPGDVPAVGLAARRIGSLDLAGEPFTLTGQPGQTLEQLLAEAVGRVQTSLDEQWKSHHLLRYDQAGSMLVAIPIARLQDWVEIDRALQSLREVSQVGILSFGRTEVQLELGYLGEPERLTEALAGLGLALSQEGDSWRLQPMAGRPSQGERPSETSTSF